MVEVIYFPKKCPHCKEPLEKVEKWSATWFECPNASCPAVVSNYEGVFPYACLYKDR